MNDNKHDSLIGFVVLATAACVILLLPPMGWKLDTVVQNQRDIMDRLDEMSPETAPICIKQRQRGLFGVNQQETEVGCE